MESYKCPLCLLPSTTSFSCLTCSSIREYRGTGGCETKKDVIFFPGPGRVVHSSTHGNYVIASRRIEEGELIIREAPLLASPYGMSDRLPFCLSCHKDIPFSAKCSKCKWPICGDEKCQQNPMHIPECEIFSSKNLRPKGLINEYFSIETLRCLLLRTLNPTHWKRVLEMENHSSDRMGNSKAKEILLFITQFIRESCKLLEFEVETIDHVVGVLSVNTFWAFKDLGKYSSLLFNKVSLFSHDCDPNTSRRILSHEEGMEVRASRVIEKHEMITTRYISLKNEVKQRRSELLDLFYFHCTCSRCLQELLDIEGLSLCQQETKVRAVM